MGQSNTKLSKSDVAEIRSRTQFSDSQLAKLLDDFKKIDKNGDGVVDLKEFATLLNSTPSDPEVQRLFSLFDMNKDQTLDAKEFICGVAFLSDKATLKGKLQIAFSMYDADGDGQISLEEYVVVLIVLNSLTSDPLPEESLAKIAAAAFALTDNDRDGHITFEEFYPVAVEHPEFFPIAGIVTLQM